MRKSLFSILLGLGACIATDVYSYVPVQLLAAPVHKEAHSSQPVAATSVGKEILSNGWEKESYADGVIAYRYYNSEKTFMCTVLIDPPENNYGRFRYWFRPYEIGVGEIIRRLGKKFLGASKVIEYTSNGYQSLEIKANALDESYLWQYTWIGIQIKDQARLYHYGCNNDSLLQTLSPTIHGIIQEYIQKDINQY